MQCHLFMLKLNLHGIFDFKKQLRANWALFRVLEMQFMSSISPVYTSYLDEQRATYMATNMGMADIPVLRERFQIPSSVKIRIPEDSERTSFYKPVEVYFYEMAFERHLRFPINNQDRDMFVSLNFSSRQLHPYSWACAIAPSSYSGLCQRESMR